LPEAFDVAKSLDVALDHPALVGYQRRVEPELSNNVLGRYW
jgi:hypothetical protein